MARVRITQIDGKLPNLALMRLASWHRERGDEVHFTRAVRRGVFEPEYDVVYGSAIFGYSAEHVALLQAEFPGAIIGGTGSGERRTVEELIGGYAGLDYSPYPDFKASIGFTQRGCRLRCPFCVVPGKEGKPQSVATIADIWRGPGHAKKLHLLDNDFFGQPEEQWRARVEEIRAGGFRVCFNQGINVRAISDEAAAALASIEYRDDGFRRRRLYTAWDNLGDEERFFRGIDTLESNGVPARHVMAYMLVGYDRRETWERIWHRFNRMTERDIRPFVMRYDRERADLRKFARWVNMGLYRIVPWAEFDMSFKTARHAHSRQGDLLDFAAPATKVATETAKSEIVVAADAPKTKEKIGRGSVIRTRDPLLPKHSTGCSGGSPGRGETQGNPTSEANSAGAPEAPRSRDECCEMRSGRERPATGTAKSATPLPAPRGRP